MNKISIYDKDLEDRIMLINDLLYRTNDCENYISFSSNGSSRRVIISEELYVNDEDIVYDSLGEEVDLRENIIQKLENEIVKYKKIIDALRESYSYPEL